MSHEKDRSRVEESAKNWRVDDSFFLLGVLPHHYGFKVAGEPY